MTSSRRNNVRIPFCMTSRRSKFAFPEMSKNLVVAHILCDWSALEHSLPAHVRRKGSHHIGSSVGDDSHNIRACPGMNDNVSNFQHSLETDGVTLDQSFLMITARLAYSFESSAQYVRALPPTRWSSCWRIASEAVGITWDHYVDSDDHCVRV